MNPTRIWTALPRTASTAALVAVATLAACGDEDPIRSGDADAGGSDVGASDTGRTDTGTTDTGATDAGTTDTGATDAGTTDTGATDAGTTDAGTTDTGATDADTTDTGTTDAGTTDTGTTDTGSADVGGEDTGGADTGGEAASWDEVNDIFFAECAGCHYGMPAGLAFADAYANLVNVESTQAPGMMRVAPGDLDGSYLWLKVTGMHGPVGSGTQMPQGGALSEEDLATLRSWILGGALP